jgi:DNA invertase Pin-like site-specific DNA recombinase
MTKAPFEIRVSTTQQTVDNQVPELERFAVHHGYEPVERYELSESA